MIEGYKARDMQISILISTIINANRDPRKGKPIKIEDVSLFFKKEKKKQKDEEKAKYLKKITYLLGGKVVE